MAWWNPIDWVKGAVKVGTASTAQFLNSDAGKPAKAGLEHAASALHTAYSTVVSRPVSTFQQAISDTGLGTMSTWSMFNKALHGQNPLDGIRPENFGQLTQGDTWGDAWKRSKYISPGQAADIARAGGAGRLGLDLDDPDSIRAYFSQGDITKGQWSKWTSGATDFIVSWYGDPLIVGGKAIKLARHGQDVETLLAKNKKSLVSATGEHRLANPEETNRAFQMTMGQLSGKKGIFTRIDKAIEGKSANEILQFNFARQNANGPMLAHLLSQAGSKSERANLFRLSLGDSTAYHNLEFLNKDVADQIKYATDRWSSLSNNMENLTFGSPAWEIAVKRMDDYQLQLGALDARHSAIKAKMSIFGTQDRFTFGTGSSFAAHARGIRHGVIQPSIYDRPITFAHSLSQKFPNGHMDLNDANSIEEVAAQLGQHKWLTPKLRDKMLSDYAGAVDKVSRERIVAGIEKTLADERSAHYGFTRAEGDAIFAAWAAQRKTVMDNTNRFSAAKFDEVQPDGTTRKVNVDTFTDDGGALIIAPALRSQLKRSHVFLDMKAYDEALKAASESGLKTVLRTTKEPLKVANALAEHFQQYWKIGVFLRLGYPIRNVSDDLLGQTARFGIAPMLSRMSHGGANFIRGNIHRDAKQTFDTLKEASQAHIDDLHESLDIIEKDIQRLLKTGNVETDKVLAQRVQAAQVQHDMGLEMLAAARAEHAKIPTEYKQGMQGFTAHGVQVPGAFEGQRGALNRAVTSSDANQAAMLGLASDRTHGLLRSGYNEIISSGVDAERHLDAWHHNVMFQLGNDAVARKVMAGESRESVQKWLIGTPEGRAHFQSLGLKNLRSGELYDRARAEVDSLLPPEHAALRQAALDGSLTKEMLDSAIPAKYRPDTHVARTDFNLGKGFLAHKADRAVTGFYKWFATMPQDILSRHPLFAQQYEAHARMLIKRMQDSGEKSFTPERVNMVVDRASELARRDVMRYSANLVHKSNAAQALRVVSPFFNATQESFARWSRIIHDKPEVFGRAVQFFNAPTRAGLVVDEYGQKVDPDGTSVDPKTGKRYVVPQNKRTIVLGHNIVPWLKEGQKIAIGQESLNMIMPGQPMGNPGVGPIVQVSANEFLKDKPELADIAKAVGILPYGISQKGIAQQFLPGAARNLADYLASDESDEDWQKVYLGILQSEYAKHQMGWRPSPADEKEIKERVRAHFGIKVLAGLTLPFAANQRSANQYLIDEYKRLQSEDPKTADAMFYEKYGDAAFAYTAHLSKTNASVPATLEGWKAFQQYRDLIAQDPELAGLIIGPDGQGEFNGNVYQAQLGTAIGGSQTDTIRTKQSPADAIADAKRREGWVIFNKYQQKFKAELTDRGLTSFEDDGAEDLKAMKQAITTVMGDPDSQFYNPEWLKDYKTFDTTKYDRLIPAMERVVEDKRLEHRSDIQSLRQYIGARKLVVQALEQREAAGGSKTLKAKKNADLYRAWNRYVGNLIEKDLDFEALHNRYLSKDLGVDIEPEEEEEESAFTQRNAR